MEFEDGGNESHCSNDTRDGANGPEKIILNLSQCICIAIHKTAVNRDQI